MSPKESDNIRRLTHDSGSKGPCFVRLASSSFPKLEHPEVWMLPHLPRETFSQLQLNHTSHLSLNFFVFQTLIQSTVYFISFFQKNHSNLERSGTTPHSIAGKLAPCISYLSHITRSVPLRAKAPKTDRHLRGDLFISFSIT